MSYTQKIILLVIIVIIAALVVIGLFAYYLQLELPVFVSEEKDERLVLQEKLEPLLDFSFATPPYTFDSIVNSEDFKAMEKQIKNLCYDPNLEKYLACPRAFIFRQFLLNKIIAGLPALDSHSQNDLSDYIIRVDKRFAAPPKEILDPQSLFKTQVVEDLSLELEKMTNLDYLYTSGEIESLQAVSEFQDWLTSLREKRIAVCGVPNDKQIQEDCRRFQDPYLSALFYRFIYFDRPVDSLEDFVQGISRGAYKTSASIRETYNQLMNQYADAALDQYVNQMKNKYPALNESISDFNLIKDFLLDSQDSYVYNVGKFYYYVNYLNLGDKEPIRAFFISDINRFYEETAVDLGISQEALKNYIRTEVGDETVIINLLISQYNEIKNNYQDNLDILTQDYLNFILYSSLTDDTYYEEMTRNFVDQENFYNDVREYRLFTYLLFYLDDKNKGSGERVEAFSLAGEDGGAMQDLFKFSRYIERDELNDFLTSFQQ